MKAYRTAVRTLLHHHVETGTSRFFQSYDRRFAPTWSPFEGLDASAVGHWAALVWASRNIGDETQTIAQTGLYPSSADIVPVNREAMNAYSGPTVGGLMNGWFLHKPGSWPPSPAIRAAYIAFHAAPSWDIDDAARAYLKAQEPIGCRDMFTLRRLADLGIDGYFSGCLTLTLKNPFPETARTAKVVVVDFETDWHRKAHPVATELYERLVPEEVRRSAVSFDQIRSKPGRYVGRRRFEQSVDMLDLLATAKLVITRRLHTALPCIAFGTPFLFIHDKFRDDPRFEGFSEYLDGKDRDTQTLAMDWDRPLPVDGAPLIEHVRESARRAAADMLGRWS